MNWGVVTGIEERHADLRGRFQRGHPLFQAFRRQCYAWERNHQRHDHEPDNAKEVF